MTLIPPCSYATDERGIQTIKEKAKQKPSLSQPATYQIKVPGEIEMNWSDWFEKLIIKITVSNDGPPITTLTCTVDQAALQSILRRLYSLGLPLISVLRIEQ